MTDLPEEEIYEQFRLSEMEFFILQRIINQREIGVVVSPIIDREFALAWEQTETYPFRKDDLDVAVIGATIGLMPI